MKTPAVAVVGYNRPAHLKATLESLAACDRFEEVDTTIFMDGPASPDGPSDVLAARDVASRFARERRARVVFHESNWGLARSIVGATDAMLQSNDRVIVIEDDLLLHKEFLRFQIEGLEHYADDERVFQISGFMYPTDMPRGRDALLLPHVTSWGWGTWARAWRHLDRDPKGALQALADRDTRHRFDLGGAYPFSQMLTDRLAGKNASWMVFWNWACFTYGGLVVYPARSLVGNLGFDGSGVHCTAQASWFVGKLDTTHRLPERITWPRPVLDEEALRAVTRFMKTAGGQALLRNRVRRLLRLAVRRLLRRG